MKKLEALLSSGSVSESASSVLDKAKGLELSSYTLSLDRTALTLTFRGAGKTPQVVNVYSSKELTVD
jgi:hypothetical protein